MVEICPLSLLLPASNMAVIECTTEGQADPHAHCHILALMPDMPVARWVCYQQLAIPIVPVSIHLVGHTHTVHSARPKACQTNQGVNKYDKMI